MARTRFIYTERLNFQEDNSLEIELREKLAIVVNGQGRPTNYSRQYDEICYRACAFLGFTDRQLQSLLGITKSTYYRWKLRYPGFAEVIQKGKDEFDSDNVEKSILKRIIGYDLKQHIVKNKALSVDKKGKILYATEVTEKDIHIPPDPKHGFTWLYNRREGRWENKAKREVTGPDGKPLTIGHDLKLKVDLSNYSDNELQVLLGIAVKNNPKLINANP